MTKPWFSNGYAERYAKRERPSNGHPATDVKRQTHLLVLDILATAYCPAAGLDGWQTGNLAKVAAYGLLTVAGAIIVKRQRENVVRIIKNLPPPGYG